MREFTFIFLLGRGIVFGLDGVEPTVIMFPQNATAGWLFIALSIFWAMPPWVLARLSKLVKRILKRRDTTQELIAKVQREVKST